MLAALLSCSENGEIVQPVDEEDQGSICPDTNQAPVLIDYPDTTVAPGTTLLIRVVAYDLNGDELTLDGSVAWGISDFRAGTIPIYTFNADMKLLEYRVRMSDRPSRRVYLYATESCGAADTTSFRVFVE